MMVLKNIPIKSKLILIIVGTGILTLITGLYIYLIYDLRALKEEHKTNALLNAKVIGQYLVDPLLQSNQEEATGILGNFEANPIVEDACLYSNLEEDIFAEFHRDTNNAQCFPIIQEEEATYSDNALNIIYTIKRENEYYGMLYIRISTRNIEQRLVHNLTVMGILTLFLFVALILAARYLQKLISEPILNLAKHAARISSTHDYSLQIRPLGNDEVAFLYTQFNNLLIQIEKRKEEQDKAEQEIVKLNSLLEKKIEERTQQLKQANKALESFAYSVSHDLKSPLRHIGGFISLLKTNIPEPTEKATQYFNKINNSVNRLNTMIDKLLSFSRLGRKEINLTEVDLNHLVREIVAHFRPDYEKRQMKWTIKKLPMVLGDVALLQIVFENLISNAIKYTSKKPVGKIEIGHINTDKIFTTVYIKDNGAGFNMEYSDKLFNVFQRLHSENEFEGSGIGLANVKQIVLKHNGKIWAESKLNEGATFFVSLKKWHKPNKG